MNLKALNVWGQIATRLAKLTPILVLLLAPSSSVLAINLGDLNIISGKFTPFIATIQVEDYDPAKIDQLQVSLASPEIHRRLGIPLTAEIKKLKFSAQLSAGVPIIKISSADAMRQAEHMLALDVRWPQGKVMMMYDMKIPQPSAEWVAYQAQRSSAEPVSQDSQIQTGKHAAPQAPEPASNDLDYTRVTIHEGITLWRIASEALPNEKVSVNQVMLAILALNPNSFELNNVNSLKAKAELKIPNHLEFEYSRKEAELEIKRQHEEWRRVKDTIKKPASAFDSEAYSETKARIMRVEAPVLQSPDSRPQQSYSKADGFEPVSERVNANDDDAIEEIELSPAATDVEQPYHQAQIEPLPEWQQLPEIEVPEAVPVDDVIIETIVAGDGDVRVTRLDSADSIPRLFAEGWAGVLTNMRNMASSLQFDNYQQRAINYWQQHQQLILLILFIIVMLLIGFRIGRNRRNNAYIAADDRPTDTITARESILSEIHASRDFGIQSGAAAAASPTTYEDDFALDSPSPSDQRGILDEVNIYLSYGLYLEALDLLTHALAQSPKHVGYLLKLAETHCLAQNPEDFVKQAERLSELVAPDSLAWKKLAGLAENIVPEHVLFALPEPPPADELAAFTAGEFELENLTQQDNLQQPDPLAPVDDSAADEFDYEDNSTKLDLAKVYIDMGDIEAARDILLTVLKEGTPEQRDEAHRLNIKIT